MGDFVTAEDGSGIVHTAPAFGEDDYAVCKKYGIKMVQPVNEKGRFTEEVKDFQGQFVHDSNKNIIEFLKKKTGLSNFLFCTIMKATGNSRKAMLKKTRKKSRQLCVK